MPSAYDHWNENRSHVAPGRYGLLKCIEARKVKFWLQGSKWGKAERIVLMFEILDGKFKGSIVPMFFPLNDENKIGQGTFYYVAWTIANGGKPTRPRLKEMPPIKFIGKVFEGEIVEVRATWKIPENDEEGKAKFRTESLPETFFYSKVHNLYSLVIGDPRT